MTNMNKIDQQFEKKAENHMFANRDHVNKNDSNDSALLF